MTGYDVMCICMGVSSLILALATARLLPELLATVERMSSRDTTKRRPPGPPSAL